MSLSVARGETLIEELTCRDRRTGQRASLVGCTVIASISKFPGEAALVVIASNTEGIVLGEEADPAAPDLVGIATLTWSAAMTATLLENEYYRDVWVIDALGNEWVVIRPEPFRVYEPVRRRAA